MPMLEACIPDGTPPPEALGKLLARLTDFLLQHEGVDPANQAARALAGVLRTARRCTSVARQQQSLATGSCARSQKASMTTNGARPSPQR